MTLLINKTSRIRITSSRTRSVCQVIRLPVISRVRDYEWLFNHYDTQGNVQNKGYTKTLVSTSMGTQIIRVHTQGDSLGFQNYYKFLRRLFIANKTKGFCSYCKFWGKSCSSGNIKVSVAIASFGGNPAVAVISRFL